jgi:hypothetical protein
MLEIRYKRLLWLPLIIAIIIIGYLNLINYLGTMDFSYSENNNSYSDTSRIGFGDSVKITVNRGYLFGMIRLPVYVAGLNFDLVHKLVFGCLILLIIAWIYPFSIGKPKIKVQAPPQIEFWE